MTAPGTDTGPAGWQAGWQADPRPGSVVSFRLPAVLFLLRALCQTVCTTTVLCEYIAPCIPGFLSAVPGLYPVSSPHLLRGDTALSLLVSCTHLMFLYAVSLAVWFAQKP